MTRRAILSETKWRLESFDAFSPDTIEHVAASIEQQSHYATYQELFDAVGVPELPTLYHTRQGRGVPLVDIPAREAPEHPALVLHLPMNNGLDTNQLYQVASVAHAFPSRRVIAFGNPSGPPYYDASQAVSLAQFCHIAWGSAPRALVAAELDYLSSRDIMNPVHIGYSYGAHKALITSLYDTAAQLVLIDPVAHPRSPWRLIQDFRATLAPLDAYVRRTDLTTYTEARHVASKSVAYDRGLRRPVNIAIGLMLARLDLATLMRRQHADTALSIAWGSESELTDDMRLKALAESSGARGLRLEGERHAFANDIPLYLAVVHDALHRP